MRANAQLCQPFFEIWRHILGPRRESRGLSEPVRQGVRELQQLWVGKVGRGYKSTYVVVRVGYAGCGV